MRKSPMDVLTEMVKENSQNIAMTDNLTEAKITGKNGFIQFGVPENVVHGIHCKNKIAFVFVVDKDEWFERLNQPANDNP